MKGRGKHITGRLSYIAVLLAMALCVGLRAVPHHHCGCSGDAAIHLGYENCSHGHDNGHQSDECGHNNDGDSSAKLCCGQFEFCRCSDDDLYTLKRILDNGFILYANARECLAVIETAPCHCLLERRLFLPNDHCHSTALRAPPVC